MTEFRPWKERVSVQFLGTLKQDVPFFFSFASFPFLDERKQKL